jgi:hypothetical protein
MCIELGPQDSIRMFNFQLRTKGRKAVNCDVDVISMNKDSAVPSIRTTCTFAHETLLLFRLNIYNSVSICNFI